MKSVSSYIKFGIPGIVFGIIIATGVQFVFSWTGPNPNLAPPNGNTDAPINVSAVDQTKAGSLTLGESVLSPIFYDANDTGYFLDPNGMSYLTNSVNFGYIYTTSNNWGLLTYGPGFSTNSEPGKIRGSIFTNDIMLRSMGNQWLSDLLKGGGGGGSVSGQAPCTVIDEMARPITMASGEMRAHTSACNANGIGLCYCFNGTPTLIYADDAGAGAGGGDGSGGGSD